MGATATPIIRETDEWPRVFFPHTSSGRPRNKVQSTHTFGEGPRWVMFWYLASRLLIFESGVNASERFSFERHSDRKLCF
jgi:hypothetical protein